MACEYLDLLVLFTLFSNRRRGRGFGNRMPDWLIDLLDLNADDLLQRLHPMLFVESVDRSSCVTTDDFVTLTLICLCVKKGKPYFSMWWCCALLFPVLLNIDF